MSDSDYDWLREESQVVERPFTSSIPGIAWLRTRWNNVAAKWYVQGLFQQQNRFNATLVNQTVNQDERLIAQDHDLVHLTKTVAELELQVKQLQKQIAKLEQTTSSECAR